MGKWTARQYRNWNDFQYGSFDAYVQEREIVIRGKLKKGNTSLYMLIKREK